jgi:hypothetical protein
MCRQYVYTLDRKGQADANSEGKNPWNYMQEKKQTQEN